MSENEEALSRIEMAAEIVSAYVEHNSVPLSELPALIASVHESLALLSGAAKPASAPEPLQPKVPIRKSVSTDFITCLEDGRRFKSLKRHLHAEHGLSPQDYRDKWGLAKDYPMVAPAYADARSNLAKTIGLGRKASPAPEAPAVEEDRGEDDQAGQDQAAQDHAAQDQAELGHAEPDAAPAGKPGRRKAKAA